MQVSEEKGYTKVNDEKGTVDFPFDLNNLFSLQYSFDQLKMAIEYLARQQGNHQTLINELLAREPGSHTVEKVIDRDTGTVHDRLGSRDGGASEKSKFASNNNVTAIDTGEGAPREVIRENTIIREVSTPGDGLGRDDLSDAVAPLQK